MDTANVNEPGGQTCYCYRAPGLRKTILDTDKVSNFYDRYVLKEQLGWGRFGIIRVCSDKLTGEVLACKSIAKERLVTGDDLHSVKHEIEIMTKLSGHPNVVDIKAVYEEEDYVHLVMELCVGGELFHRLEENGRFSESEARVLFRHLMEVILFCHDKGIVHRDLKPENILLASTSSSSIKLADFGLATYIYPGQKLYGTVGSPFYIAPEVLAGGYNQAADVWSAGVILYILLSGMPPFWGKTKSMIFDAVKAADLRFSSNIWNFVSSSAKDLICKMLLLDPSKRLTAAQVLDHSWMKADEQDGASLCEDNVYGCTFLDVGNQSFSSYIARDQDYSFHCGSPTFDDACRSSFASFLVESNMPSPDVGGFSFSSCCEINVEFSTPVPSFPSFTFFNPCSETDELDNIMGYQISLPSPDPECGETSLGKHVNSPSLLASTTKESGVIENKPEFRRAGISGYRSMGIHKRRNHTIGLGELDQLNVIVVESMIRWASCTNVPGAESLRSSLVC
uniref:Protein kinase domain-containing protein n=1 Tax=Kalanchoe fedtschenkoi TaxID=63787 RepID=A0A7N0SZG7_KALFE